MQLTCQRHQFSEAVGYLACPSTSEQGALEWHVRPGIQHIQFESSIDRQQKGRNFSKSTEIAEQTLLRENEPHTPSGRSKIQPNDESAPSQSQVVASQLLSLDPPDPAPYSLRMDRLMIYGSHRPPRGHPNRWPPCTYSSMRQIQLQIVL